MHEALGPGTPAAKAIGAQFGGAFLRPDGGVDRARPRCEGLQRSRESRGSSKRSSIQLCTTPSASGTRRWNARWASHRSRCSLRRTEKGISTIVVVTVCSARSAAERILERDGISEAEARQRIAAQMPAAGEGAAGRLCHPHRRHDSWPPTDRSTSSDSIALQGLPSLSALERLDVWLRPQTPSSSGSFAGAIRSSTNVFHSWQCGHCQSSSVLR